MWYICNWCTVVLQVQAANILFVDNPVGTGYSYVDDTKDLTTNVTGIADDLVTLLIAFLNKYQIFKVNTSVSLSLCVNVILLLKRLPFYVFSESYGGKMTAAFGVAINAVSVRYSSIICDMYDVI